MSAIEDKLGYAFRSEELLRQALTHPSYWGAKKGPDYQRMEFLGDAVLEYAVSRRLFAMYPQMDEGELTRARARLVKEETLAEAARALELGREIRMSPGEAKLGGADKPSILCDVFESVLAAVLLDGGLDKAEELALRALAPFLKGAAAGSTMDAKSRLQELLQSGGNIPEYEHLSTEGPPHAPVFRYRVLVNGETLGEGEGRSKQAAQQQAAEQALAELAKKQ